MKIVPKFKGGGISSLFSTYTSLPQERQKSTSRVSSKEDNSDKKELTEKDFFSMLKDIDGLPNDMRDIVSELMATFQLKNLTGIDIDDLANTYLSSLYKIRVAAQNKKRYDAVLDNAGKNGALYEPAITPSGELIAQNEDGIQQISVQEYLQNKEEYQGRLLTVSQLANLRAYDPTLAYDTSIFSIIDNGVGFESFQALLKQALTDIGSTQVSRDGLFSYEGQAAKGLELLQTLSQEDKAQLLGSVIGEGQYQYQVKDENQVNQINSLLDYIISTFPERAKIWASLKTGKADSEEATRTLVAKYLVAGANIKHDLSITYKEPNKEKTSSEKTGKAVGSETELNTAAKWALGFGNSETIIINPGTALSRMVNSITMPLVKANGDPLGANSTLQQATEGQYGAILDLTNVTMGMDRIDPAFFNQVVLSDGKISSIDFPCRIVGGRVVPDLSKATTAKKVKADQILKAKGIDVHNQESIKKNYGIINQVYQQLGLPAAYNSDGSLDSNTWRRFGVINASTDGRVLGEDAITEGLSEITDDYKVDNIVSIMQANNKDYTFSHSWFGSDTLYQGTIWIPVKPEINSALAGEKMKVGEVMDIESRQQAPQIQEQLKSKLTNTKL